LYIKKINLKTLKTKNMEKPLQLIVEVFLYIIDMIKTFEQYNNIDVDVIIDMFNRKMEGFHFNKTGRHVELNDDSLESWNYWNIVNFNINKIEEWVRKIPDIEYNENDKDIFMEISYEILNVINDKEYMKLFIDNNELGLI